MSVNSSGMDDALTAALVEVPARSPAALARIRQLVALEPAPANAPAYTVAALAGAIGVSARATRGAITRGDLAAVKRGGRRLISADAVRAWTARDGSYGHVIDELDDQPRLSAEDAILAAPEGEEHSEVPSQFPGGANDTLA